MIGDRRKLGSEHRITALGLRARRAASICTGAFILAAATSAIGAHSSEIASELVIRAKRGRMCLKLNACISTLMALHKSSGITSS
jgi:hypothetical protein